MANKSVYQSFDPAALQHFDLVSTPEYGVLTTSGVETVKLTNSVDKYDKIKNIIFKDTLDKTTFKTKKKGFLLPMSPVSLDRIKSSCKHNGILLTNNYEEADFIITHDNFYGLFQNGEKIKTSKMMCKLWNYDAYNNSNNHIPEVEKYNAETNNLIIYDDKWEKRVNNYRLNISESIYDLWMLTGLAINIAYKIQIGQLDVINANTIVRESGLKQVLDEDLVKDLLFQIKSYNVEDTSMAGMIIPTIDYTQKLHLLWYFAQESYIHMYKFNKNKDVQYWKEVSEYNKFCNRNALDMILFLEKENKLDSESFRYLEPIVRKKIKIINRDLYIFKVEVKPEYKKYLIKNKSDV